MGATEIAKDLISTVNKLGALEARTADVAKNQERIEAKLDGLIDRLARIEANYENLRANVKNEVMSEIGRELTKMQVILDLQAKGLLPAGLLLGGEAYPQLEQRKITKA